MAHLNIRSASLLVAWLLAVGHSGLRAEESTPDEVGTLERQIPKLIERGPSLGGSDSDLRETRIDVEGIGTQSIQSDPFVGVLAEHSSVAELHRSETLRPSDGIWRTSHTRNPMGDFSLVRSTAPMRVSIGNAPTNALEARETLELPCGEAEEIRIETDAGKVIYTGEMRCGDAIYVNREVAP